MPAHADIAALYGVQSEDDFEQAMDFAMTIEVNGNGNARLHITGRTSYFLIRNGEVYKVSKGIDGPYAEKLSDLEAVIANAGQAGGISLELVDQFPSVELVDSGKTKVGSWEGSAFAQREYGELGRPELVISEDATLKPIGEAFAQFIDGRFGALRSLLLINLFGSFGLYDPEVLKLISSGTPIRLNSLELASLSQEEIDPARFELPARVLTREEITAMNKPFDWAPAFRRQPAG